ncbi:MAG TPA: hypothetical protein VI997_06630 [Candidatus Thermoplasmatota archaeon]|nr:hypothetical protein [Candidatus Thermoplasmatota archaeon]
MDSGWATPLGVASLLFAAYGAFWVLIGVMTPLALGAGRVGSTLFWTPAADAHAFAPPGELLAREPAVAKLRDAYLVTIAGLLVAGGAAIACVAWFALREGATWAAIALTFAGASVVPFWWLVTRTYLAGGWRFTLADVPPFMWVPTALWLVATPLAWWGLR